MLFTPTGNAPLEELTCGIDVVTNVQIDEDSETACANLSEGIGALAQQLGATVVGQVDERAIVQQVEAVAALRDEARAAIDLELTADGSRPFRLRDIHGVARGLGFDRSDFGSYAWFNETGVGDEELVTIRPGDDVGAFDFSDPSASYEALSFGFDLDQVPLPEVVAERLWASVAAFQRQLGGRITDRETGHEVTEASLRQRVHAAVSQLAARDLVVGAVVAPEL